LRRNQLGYHFRRQQVIAGFIVDFYCDTARLVVEVDGPIHEVQTNYDESRTKLLIEWGIVVLRVTNKEVLRELEETLARIREMCQTRG
jgi:very-short-patch-repair endonuclease